MLVQSRIRWADIYSVLIQRLLLDWLIDLRWVVGCLIGVVCWLNGYVNQHVVKGKQKRDKYGVKPALLNSLVFITLSSNTKRLFLSLSRIPISTCHFFANVNHVHCHLLLSNPPFIVVQKSRNKPLYTTVLQRKLNVTFY